MKEMTLAALLFIAAGTLSAQQSVSAYMNYLDTPVYNYSGSQAESELAEYQKDDFTDRAYSIEKGLLLFWASSKSLKDEELASKAVQHWKRLYSASGDKDPLALAFFGTVSAIYGGAISAPDPITKTRLALDGMAKISEAQELLKNKAKDDQLALGFIYFLDGFTRSSLPSFFKEREAAPDKLKLALKFYSQARKRGIYTKNLIYHLVAHTYYGYAVFHISNGEVRKGLKYLDRAEKYLNELDGIHNLAEEIEKKRSKIE